MDTSKFISDFKSLNNFYQKMVFKQIKKITLASDYEQVLKIRGDDLDNKCTNNNKYGNKIGVEIGTGAGESHGMVLLEVEVNATKSDGTVIARILRRTLQQP